ncbi:MAG: hypothetical protein SF069_12040 [Phycisphaerae bacterium]|nr:hypothetical protein [Phycisphaerae bacterium]
MSTKDRPEAKPRSVPWHLRGLPELELFESTAQRDIAIERFNAEYRDWSHWESLADLLGLIVSLFLVDIAEDYLSRAVGAPRWFKPFMCLILVAPLLVLALRFARSRSAKSLRESLLSLGIPVCRGCGYCLRGLPPDSSRCPECARPLDAETEKLLDK